MAATRAAAQVERSSVPQTPGGIRPAYQRSLRKDAAERVEALEAKLDQNLTGKYHFLVMDARGGVKEPAVGSGFAITVSGRSSYEDLQTVVKQLLELPVEAGDLTLVFEGHRLRAGARLESLGLADAGRRWSAPYAGVLWVVPKHIEPSFVRRSFAVKW